MQRDQRDRKDAAPPPTAPSVPLVPSSQGPFICANVILGLVKVTNFLLDRQIKALERAFVEQGGLREAMTRARLEYRAKGRKGPKG